VFIAILSNLTSNHT